MDGKTCFIHFEYSTQSLSLYTHTESALPQSYHDHDSEMEITSDRNMWSTSRWPKYSLTLYDLETPTSMMKMLMKQCCGFGSTENHSGSWVSENFYIF